MFVELLDSLRHARACPGHPRGAVSGGFQQETHRSTAPAMTAAFGLYPPSRQGA
jgi:hypothetical protein